MIVNRPRLLSPPQALSQRLRARGRRRPFVSQAAQVVADLRLVLTSALPEATPTVLSEEPPPTEWERLLRARR